MKNWVIVGILVVVGISTVVVAYAVSSGRSSKPSSSEASTRLLTEPTYEPLISRQGSSGGVATPRPTAVPKSVRKEVAEESGTTVTGWTYEGHRDVIVSPGETVAGGVLTVEFERESFEDILSIYYNLTYSDGSGTTHGVEGTFNPADKTQNTNSRGNVYVAEELLLGSCSLGVCTYHEDLKLLRLFVKTTRVGFGGVYEQTLTRASL